MIDNRYARQLVYSRDYARIKSAINANNVNDMNNVGSSWLSIMCFDNKLSMDVLRYVIHDCKARVNARDAFGDTALRMAVLAHNYDGVSLLLASGADPDTINLGGATPLVFAMELDHPIAFMLMDYGAKLSNIPAHFNARETPWEITHFETGRERARHAGVILMGALKRRKRVHRDLIPLIGQMVWSMRGLTNVWVEADKKRKHK
jgi:hypothetical protein